MTPTCHVQFGGGLGEQEHRDLARSLPYCDTLCGRGGRRGALARTSGAPGLRGQAATLAEVRRTVVA